MSRKRKETESYEEYKINLKKENAERKQRIKSCRVLWDGRDGTARKFFNKAT